MKQIDKHTGGRPPVQRKKVKSKMIKIRVSEDEMRKMKSKANKWGLTVSQYVRDVAFTHNISKMVITSNSDIARLTAEANKIGVNLNQIARNVNVKEKYRDYFAARDMSRDELATAIKNVEKQLDRLNEQLLNAREEFRHEQMEKISDFEYKKNKEFWFPNDQGDDDGSYLYPYA